MNTTSDADDLAKRVADDLWPRDGAPHLLGMELLEVTAGRARLRLRITDTMTNSHGIAHGGMIFTLADTAFAYACNSGNQTTVAAHCSITFVAPVRVGDLIEADAREQVLRGKSGVYDASVRNVETGEIVALFRGNSHRIGGAIVAD